MPRKALVRLLFGIGAALCVPAAIVIILFTNEVANLDALETVRPCAVPNRDGQANCLSILTGRITEVTPGGSKALPGMTIVFKDTSATVLFERSPASFHAGEDVTTGWWKGRLVLLGPPEGAPTIITDQHPEYRLGVLGYGLGIGVIPAASLLLAALLVLQAPMKVDELVNTTIARWPNPPRPVDRVLAWRVALAYLIYGAYIVWMVLDIVGELVLLGIKQERYSPWVLVATLVVSCGFGAAFASAYFSHVIRTSARRTVVIRKLKRGMGRGGHDTEVWYDLSSGSLATTFLAPPWNGRVNEGDRLDVLSDPKSGTILRLLSTPPA
jgi:hypothetical protein